MRPAKCTRSGPYQGKPPEEGEMLFERVYGDTLETVLRWRLGGVVHVWRIPFFLEGAMPEVERYDG